MAVDERNRRGGFVVRQPFALQSGRDVTGVFVGPVLQESQEKRARPSSWTLPMAAAIAWRKMARGVEPSQNTTPSFMRFSHRRLNVPCQLILQQPEANGLGQRLGILENCPCRITLRVLH